MVFYLKHLTLKEGSSMSNSNTFHVGIDVDDSFFHATGFCRETGEYREFKCRASNAKLIGRLKKWEEEGFRLETCHESSYLGFALHRHLQSKGIASTVVASSLIPETPGSRVKTDRIDGRKLARLFAIGELTLVHAGDGDRGCQKIRPS